MKIVDAQICDRNDFRTCHMFQGIPKKSALINLFRKNDITSKIGKRLVKSSNTGIAEIQNLMEIIYHPESIRRLCFYLFSKTEDTNQRSEISEWIRNQPRTVEIDGEPSTNTKEYSITFKSDKDLTGTFSIFESSHITLHHMLFIVNMTYFEDYVTNNYYYVIVTL